MTVKNKNLKSLDQFIDEKIGKVDTNERERFEADYNVFKLGVLIQQARERNLKDIRFSTLQRIINEGLGGHLDISIKF